MHDRNKILLINKLFHIVNPSYGLSIDCQTKVIHVEIEKLCEKHRKTFEQICQDENTINQILDTFLEMRKAYSIKIPL